MKDHVGERFEGTVTAVVGLGRLRAARRAVRRRAGAPRGPRAGPLRGRRRRAARRRAALGRRRRPWATASWSRSPTRPSCAARSTRGGSGARARTASAARAASRRHPGRAAASKTPERSRSAARSPRASPATGARASPRDGAEEARRGAGGRRPSSGAGCCDVLERAAAVRARGEGVARRRIVEGDARGAVVEQPRAHAGGAGAVAADAGSSRPAGLAGSAPHGGDAKVAGAEQPWRAVARAGARRARTAGFGAASAWQVSGRLQASEEAHAAPGPPSAMHVALDGSHSVPRAHARATSSHGAPASP